MGLCSGSKEAVYLRRPWNGIAVLTDVKLNALVKVLVESTPVYVYNQGCIALA